MLPSGFVSILVEDLWFTTCSGYSDQYELPAGMSASQFGLAGSVGVWPSNKVSS